MSRRRIVILQDTLRPGGTERQSVWLARSLKDDETETVLLLFRPPGKLSLPSGVHVECLQNRSFRPDWYAPRLIARLRSLGAGLVLCMGRNANCYAGWIRGRLPGVPVIATCRTSRALPLPYRHGISKSHRCLTNTRWAAERIVSAGLKARDDIVTIPNALLRPELLEIDRSAAGVADARRRLGLAEDGIVVSNIASFVSGKNKEAILRSFADSRQAAGATLLLAGAGPGLAACRRLAAALRVEDRVRFLGHTERIEPILQCSDLFVSTALRDALPNALVEAQAAGLPVIAYDTGGCAEAFLPERSGISVRAGDETGFSEAINALLESEEKRHAFSVAARAHARRVFHPDTIAARYRAFIDRELDDSPDR